MSSPLAPDNCRRIGCGWSWTLPLEAHRMVLTTIASNDLVVGEDYMVGTSSQWYNWQTGWWDTINFCSSVSRWKTLILYHRCHAEVSPWGKSIMTWPQGIIWSGAPNGGWMSISGLSSAGLIGGSRPQQIISVWCPRASESDNLALRMDTETIHWAGWRNLFYHRISKLVGHVSGLATVHPLFTLHLSCIWCGVAAWSVRHWQMLYFARIGSSISSWLLIVYVEPAQTVWCYLALTWSVKFQEYWDEACMKTKCRLRQQHHASHSWLPAKVMYSANSTKCLPWLTRSISIFFLGVQIYQCYRQKLLVLFLLILLLIAMTICDYNNDHYLFN